MHEDVFFVRSFAKKVNSIDRKIDRLNLGQDKKATARRRRRKMERRSIKRGTIAANTRIDSGDTVYDLSVIRLVSISIQSNRNESLWLMRQIIEVSTIQIFLTCHEVFILDTLIATFEEHLSDQNTLPHVQFKLVLYLMKFATGSF